jgi:hypothetical protein
MPTRFVSVPDMMFFHAQLLLYVVRGSGLYVTASAVPGWRESALTPDGMHQAEIWQKIAEHCTQLGFSSSAATARRLSEVHRPDQTMGAISDLYQEFYGRLRDELNGRRCFMVEADKLTFFEDLHPFGVDVAARFSGFINDNIEEAGKCLALDRGTACVFHLMRAVEGALHVFATKLGTTFNPTASWQVIVNDMRTTLKRLPQGTPDEKQLFIHASGAVAHLENVKDAWRNETMHPRGQYTEEMARDVWVHTKALMAKLADFV